MGKTSSLNNKLKTSYSNLERISESIKDDYNKMEKADFYEREWKKEETKIKNDIQAYKNLVNEIKTTLQKLKKKDKSINDGFERIKTELEPKIKIIEQNIQKFELMQEGFIVEQNLKESKEYLEAKKNAFDEVKKTYELIKQTKENMMKDVKMQSDLLDDIEKQIEVEEQVIQKKDDKKRKK